MPLGLQPKLLRVLQERSVRPLGATAETPIDVRIVTATNRDLESALEAKTFREDLYFRINVIHLEPSCCHLLRRGHEECSAAARVLGFERKTLYRKLEHFGVEAGARSSTPSPNHGEGKR
jgi:transcriptional regulator with PAS, ATPase and Fis domain